MNQVYLFNDAVYFYAEYARLFNQRNGCEATISQAGARCLLALLEKPGDVVSAQALIYAGWGSQGIVVTPNSLRQIINQLRKAIKKVGLPDDTLITQPRMGYKLSHLISVTLSAHPASDTTKILSAEGAVCTASRVVEAGSARERAVVAPTVGDQTAVVDPSLSIISSKIKRFYKSVTRYLTRYGTFCLFITCMLISVWNIFFYVRHVERVTPYQCTEKLIFTKIDNQYHRVIFSYNNDLAQGEIAAKERVRPMRRDEIFSLKSYDDRFISINGRYHAGTFHAYQCKQG